ncbi:acyltransferase 3 protein [Rhizobium gallicum bv. gallicum R602sp]|uniref:Acyltransferase 3 protein n=1 Tax=Rhizobium gallicum bv. gallicum R602sp TaxID=1041138 RepID=A0A0B4X2C3_9HYPH|nr:acyltransferase family protein [Rhizobium gallicum]AJD42154.1 acyltransferase 3 protein [Rhizobium gallicum bv. gallicum R602sp]
MKYRAEIDGLRAIAVLSVILFHSGVSFLPGGFVGVDVFFVISGYLITAIIIGQMTEQTFSAADFYLRRAKRILPALFAMMFVTALVGAALLTPPAFERLMRSIGEASLSISNFSFARAAGYFDEGTAWRPMLHTWSLGVEEQFYLFLPLYLFIARSRTSWSWQRIVTLPMIISFAIAVVMVRHWPTAAYYLPFGRFWELLVGSLLATGTFGAIRDDRRRQAASAAGLALIAIPVLFYGENTTFPGETALLPCLGAFLILHSARSGRSFVSTALASTPLAFIGKLSYSLYLWHWPVLYFARIIKGQALTAGEGLALLPLTFAVSYAAWRFIENPARRSDASFRTAAKLVAATVATCISLWVVTEQLGGMPGRFSGVERRMASGARDTNPDRRACDTPSLERLRAGTPCVLGADKVPGVALMGDSIADALAPGVVAAAEQAGQSVMILTKEGCRPIIWSRSDSGSCQRFLVEAEQLLKRTETIHTVVIIARWTNIASGYRYGAPILVPPSMTHPDDEAKLSRLAAALSDQFAHLDQKRIVVVGFVPEQPLYVPQTVLVRHRLGQPLPSGVSRDVFEERQKIVRRLFSRPNFAKVTLIDATPFFCNDETCPVQDQGIPAFVDDNHPSASKALSVRAMFAPAFVTRERLQSTAKAPPVSQKPS